MDLVDRWKTLPQRSEAVMLLTFERIPNHGKREAAARKSRAAKKCVERMCIVRGGTTP
jgi:hypothetical protein